MDRLRMPFFLLALFLMLVVVGLEFGSNVFTGIPREPVTAQMFPEGSDEREAFEDLDASELQAISKADNPPGLGIPYLGMLDIVLLFTLVLWGSSEVISKDVYARLQGLVTLIVTIIIIILSIVMLLAAISLLLLMVGLLLAVPFGTIAYFASYAFFDKGGAAVILSMIMGLKIGFCVVLILAHQRFVENRKLVMLILTSFVGTVLISLLHGLVPGFLVSITDAIAGIIVLVLALIWALVLGVTSPIAIIKAFKPSG